MTAVLSTCGSYRYSLTRTLSNKPGPSVCFIMLNPSTADATIDDPTIRRCMSFAKREGMSEMTVVNLFAFRATDPDELREATNARGPNNDLYLANAMMTHDLVIAAWGAHPFAVHRAAEFTKQYGPFRCLGKTRDGHPRHPLYVRSTSPLEMYP